MIFNCVHYQNQAVVSLDLQILEVWMFGRLTELVLSVSVTEWMEFIVLVPVLRHSFNILLLAWLFSLKSYCPWLSKIFLHPSIYAAGDLPVLVFYSCFGHNKSDSSNYAKFDFSVEKPPELYQPWLSYFNIKWKEYWDKTQIELDSESEWARITIGPQW